MGEVKHIPFIWDVDNTITDGNQQEPLFAKYQEAIRRQFKELGIRFNNPNDYFGKSDRLGGEKGITYLTTFVWDADEEGAFEGLTSEELRDLGRKVKLADGFVEGLKALQERYKGKVEFHHFLVSVGITPMIEGMVEENGLEELIEGIFASDFTVNEKGVINGISRAVIPFSKNEWIISLMKGESSLLNVPLFKSQYRFDYQDMVVCGDGFTDISMFAFGKKKGGTPVCVYKPGDVAKYTEAISMVGDWADYFLPRSYAPGSQTFAMFCQIVDKILARTCSFRPAALYDLRKGNTTHPDEVKCVLTHLEKCGECQEYYVKTRVTPYATIERNRLHIEMQREPS